MTGVYITVAVLFFCTTAMFWLAKKARPFEERTKEIYKKRHIDSRLYEEENDHTVFMH